jgi:hypothetical protein
MSFNISFETALAILAMAYIAPLMLLLAASNTGITMLETFEDFDS